MKGDKAVNWLLCYDIADPKRLQKIHNRVSRQGLMVQYSVYYLHASEVQLEELLGGLKQLIQPGEDDIRVYPVPENPAARMEGHGGIARPLLAGGDNDADAGWLLFGDGGAVSVRQEEASI